MAKQRRALKKERNTGFSQVNENEHHISHNDWDLEWFKPTTAQQDVVRTYDEKVFTIINAPSGCGKSSIALHIALSELKNRQYDKLIFAKNPTEVGDDQIGFLNGSEQNKLTAHYETTKYIFQDFMSAGKLESMINNKNIRLTIPNFLLGATFENSIVILDECQLMSPETMKLLLERCGKGTKYLLLGDNRQRYAVKKRKDGFSDLIERVKKTNPSLFGLIEMTREDNQRSDGSKQVLELYEDM